jgi:hypothetical protein
LEQKKLPEQFGSMHPSLGGYEQGLHCNWKWKWDILYTKL